MKISIVSAAYNSAKTIRDTIESILSQDYPDKEYVVADGGSTDGTIEILKSYGDKIKWISEPDKGIFDAMSKGVKMATGDVVGIIGSDDFYANNQVFSKVAAEMQKTGASSAYGDLFYVENENVTKVVRKWKSGEYSRENFLTGWMPPHVAFFLKKAAYDEFGVYDKSFKGSGDYELMLRMLYKHELSSCYIPEVLTYMRTGGNSNGTLKSYWRSNQEDRLSWKINEIEPHWYTLLLKPISKISQFF
jgi:glycosyltransferase involved in cell wall biosynthesis